MECSIRHANREDLEDIVNLLEQLWSEAKLDSDVLNELLIMQMQDHTYDHFVITQKDQIVGYGAVHYRIDLQSEGKIAYLSELIIDSDFQSQGIGSQFLQHIISHCKDNNCVELQFPSTFKRTKAHAFYEKHGFQKTAYFFWKRLN